MKKILVTGGCGYIGSHVARAFKCADPDNWVYIIDRVERPHTLKDIDGWYIGDYADADALATIIDIRPDVIVHCAGTSLVGPSMLNPSEYYDNNILKTIKLLNVLKDLDKKPVFMFSSSASVYGEPEMIPIPETSKIHPISPYGNTKAITETILADYYIHDISSICFRYFNAAGAEPFNFDLGQEPNATHIVARALEASINNRAFTIYGDNFNTPDGTCVRDYVHVWDIALAHVKGAAFLEQARLTAAGGVYCFNLGTNKGVSNKQIVDYVANKYKLPFVNYGPHRPGDPATLIADATKANVKLGWYPQYSNISTIIDSAYKWYTR